jgi:hypothetical protein
MELKYFIVDRDEQLQRALPEAIEAFWKGEQSADELPCDLDESFRLITVLADEELHPVICYFARLEVEDGKITNASKIAAFEAMSSRRRRRYDSPAAQQQFRGWPGDWQHQLAVALDVPAAALKKIGLGGPLLMSDLWGIPLDQVVNYFEEANEK